jgi:hypothetical protein
MRERRADIAWKAATFTALTFNVSVTVDCFPAGQVA